MFIEESFKATKQFGELGLELMCFGHYSSPPVLCLVMPDFHTWKLLLLTSQMWEPEPVTGSSAFPFTLAQNFAVLHGYTEGLRHTSQRTRGSSYRSPNE